MKHGFSVFLLIGALTLFGCQADRITSAELITAEEGELGATASKASHNTTDVLLFSDLSVVGTSSLVRNKNGVSMTMQTTGLDPGFAYTVWWVIFDTPGGCTAGGCGAKDFGNAAAGATIVGPAAGNVAGGSGQAGYAGHRKKGDSSGEIPFEIGDGTLDNPLTAEIHLVIRCHGPAIPGLIPDQIGTFNGGCNAGEPNEDECEDIQFAVHIP